MFPRSRKMGRMVPNARFRKNMNAPTSAMAITVISALMRNRTTSAITAVTSPPRNSTRPVPTRFRTPSTSLMMRETSVPVLLES